MLTKDSIFGSQPVKGGLCMRGRIYTEQKCPICKGTLTHDDRRRGLYCEKHSDQCATRKFIVRFGRNVTKRAKTYHEAERILDGLRWETDKGSFDIRDYKKGNPLGFENLARKWLSVKKKEVKPKSYNNLKNYMQRAVNDWGQINIKNIGYGEIEDFLFTQDVSDKTRSNIKSCLHTFWTWLRKRKVLSLAAMPEFPETTYELGWRQTVDRETQEQILHEVYKISYHINPKIWLGIKWLATYISIRPGELIRIKEKEIDVASGYIFIPRPKEKKAKVVPMIEEDISLLKIFPRGLPELLFFRHPRGRSGVKAGTPFGPRYLYKWWKKACNNLGIEGVDLYGGTKHSTAIALRKVATPEEIKRAMMESTNKAFERYYRIEADEVRSVYERTKTIVSSEQHPNNIKPRKNLSNILKLKE